MRKKLKRILYSLFIFLFLTSLVFASSDTPTKLIPADSNMRSVAVQYIQNDDGTYSKVDSGSPLPVSGSFSLTGMADIGDISKGTQTNDVKITLDGEEITETNSAYIKTAIEKIDDAISGNEMQVDVLSMPSVAVTGTFYQVTQPVSGTFYQATQPISGTVISNVATTIVRKETSQDLSSAVLSYTTNFAAKTRIKSIMLHASGNITETVAFTFDSKTGANYDTVLISESLSAEANVLYIPDSDLVLESGDEILVACTNDGGVNVVYATVLGESLN